MFERTYIIGVGLLGSSLGMNLISKKLSREVVGVGRDMANLKMAQRRKAIHRYIVAGSKNETGILTLTSKDLVILAAPVTINAEYLKKIPAGVLVIDVGSVKGEIVRVADRFKKRFVGCHPIAGTEKTGAIAGEKDLFKNRFCIITPSKKSSKSDVLAVTKLWKSVGAIPQLMTAAKHDALFALTSHLPHVLAYTLMSQAVKNLKVQDWKFAFTSFRDATRVAASSVTMWADILIENKKEVLKAVSIFKQQLHLLEALIAKEDKKTLLNFLSQGQRAGQHKRVGL